MPSMKAQSGLFQVGFESCCLLLGRSSGCWSLAGHRVGACSQAPAASLLGRGGPSALAKRPRGFPGARTRARGGQSVTLREQRAEHLSSTSLSHARGQGLRERQGHLPKVLGDLELAPELCESSAGGGFERISLFCVLPSQQATAGCCV